MNQITDAKIETQFLKISGRDPVILQGNDVKKRKKLNFHKNFSKCGAVKKFFQKRKKSKNLEKNTKKAEKTKKN